MDDTTWCGEEGQAREKQGRSGSLATGAFVARCQWLQASDKWPARLFSPTEVREFYITAIGCEDGFALLPKGYRPGGQAACNRGRCAVVWCCSVLATFRSRLAPP